MRFAMEHSLPSERNRIDRRLDQRSDCLVGLRRWLEASRRDLGLGAIALADAEGCLVAGAGPAQGCEELAALAPLGNSNGTRRDPRCVPLAAGVGWLCAPDIPADQQAWRRVHEGCMRILGLAKAA
jgi:hypothetical protein